MTAPQEPHSVGAHTGARAGAHGLGPHVVGQRVVVRRLLRGETGPSGGPALTDVLGTCVSWQDGACVVRPESGPEVRIAVSDIVSGKPVPPRPPVRHRVDPAAAHRRAMWLFPGLQTDPVGRWTLRHSPAHDARRANSVLAMEPSGADDAYDRVVAFYGERDRRPIAAVLRETAEEALFLGHGWVPESGDADTVFELAGPAAARRALRQLAVPGVELSLDEHDDQVTARVGERACGVGAVDGDWVGFRSIAVDPAHRRQGLALAVMSALLSWGAERGATTAYLQVLADNEPALALYTRLGFTEHHQYRYLALPLGG